MSRVRSFTEDDAERASEILVAAFRSFLGERFTEEDAAHFSPDELRRAATAEDRFGLSRLFVAEDDEGRLAGVVKVTARTNGLGVFDFVGVDPDTHAKGTGTLLMERAEAFWREHGQRKIDTCVSAHNKKALFYYLKHDFVPEGTRRDHFREGIDEIVLGRFL